MTEAASGKRVLVTGGAGFVGSHLCEWLLSKGCAVVCFDDMTTGSIENVMYLARHPRFEYIEKDVVEPIEICGELDEIYHLASPASPADFKFMPLEIMKASSYGTHNCLELALQKNARFMLASTSEIYGDPLVCPQPEDYRGNVSTTGIRSVYDEAKRYAEAATMAYARHHGLQTRIARIFNTYGPRSRVTDGRMVPNFVSQALAGKSLTIYGDGTQTRSVQYIDDLLEGVLRLMDSDETRPVNIGSPVEHTVDEIADLVLEISGSESSKIYKPLPVDDPRRRCPDISRAREVLGWEPKVSARGGIEKTVAWFRAR